MRLSGLPKKLFAPLEVGGGNELIGSMRLIAVLEQIFLDLGFKGNDAHIRARITYYHQVGYYALGIRESRKQRLELIPFYTKVLTGRGV